MGIYYIPVSVTVAEVPTPAGQLALWALGVPSAVTGHPSHWLPWPRGVWLAQSGVLRGPWHDWAGRGRP